MAFTGGGLLYGLISLTSIAAGVYQGQQSQKQQEKALNQQRTVQQKAEDIALRQRKDAAQAAARAARQEPNYNEIMAGEESLSRLGGKSTTLTGNAMRAPSRITTLGGY
jgi:hypothetical protein